MGEGTIFEEIGFEPIMRLNKDLKAAADKLEVNEIRYLVDMYYQFQKYRIQTSNQIANISKQGEPTEIIIWLSNQEKTLENRIKSILDRWTDTDAKSVWAKSVMGIGPVLAAGLAAHIDIEKAPTAGHIWSFAGLVPTIKWEKGCKRPWNAKLKTLCWKIGESFVKVKNRDKDFYGKIYQARKDYETVKNENFEYRELAEEILRSKNFGENTIAYSYYIKGQLPPGHIHSRAQRYAVKMFLSHYQQVAYMLHYNENPPKPYVIEHLGHVDLILPHNIELARELMKNDKLRK
jgi:hypothetical protein